jgi:hypothetical protein
MLNPEWLQYINHSCDPNVAFDTAAFKLIALKDVKPGDELCFFYPSTGPYAEGRAEGRAFLCTLIHPGQALHPQKVGFALQCLTWPSVLLATEWKMAAPFTCCCGKKSCCGEIKGASEMPVTTLVKYRLSEFIASKLGLGAGTP